MLNEIDCMLFCVPSRLCRRVSFPLVLGLDVWVTQAHRCQC